MPLDEQDFPFETIDQLFTYHPPQPADIEKYEAIRVAARSFAWTIRTYAPRSSDRTVAIRHIREAVMNANAAIALAPSRATSPVAGGPDSVG